jgi:transcriptional regulator with XRE-family HTH domain
MRERSQQALALSIGKRIHDLRKERGMKQATLAFEAGYTNRSTIAQIENGLTLPSVDKVIEIARALGVPPGILLDDWEKDVSTISQAETRWTQAHKEQVARKLRRLANEIESSEADDGNKNDPSSDEPYSPRENGHLACAAAD